MRKQFNRIRNKKSESVADLEISGGGGGGALGTNNLKHKPPCSAAILW